MRVCQKDYAKLLHWFRETWWEGGEWAFKCWRRSIKRCVWTLLRHFFYTFALGSFAFSRHFWVGEYILLSSSKGAAFPCTNGHVSNVDIPLIHLIFNFLCLPCAFLWYLSAICLKVWTNQKVAWYYMNQTMVQFYPNQDNQRRTDWRSFQIHTFGLNQHGTSEGPDHLVLLTYRTAVGYMVMHCPSDYFNAFLSKTLQKCTRTIWVHASRIIWPLFCVLLPGHRVPQGSVPDPLYYHFRTEAKSKEKGHIN